MPVLNGSETKPHQFPWTVFLYLLNDSNDSMCGGSLITQKHILTAAHCVQGITIGNIGAILGAHDYDVELNSWNFMYISDIYIYPDFDDGERTQTFNKIKHSPNVAVLQLEDSVKFGPKIQAICLPSQLMTRNLFEDKQAIIAGWNIIGPANADYHNNGKLMACL